MYPNDTNWQLYTVTNFHTIVYLRDRVPEPHEPTIYRIIVAREQLSLTQVELEVK